MLDGCTELSLDFLNQASQAWVEIEYHRAMHRETGCTPLERFAQAPDVLRASPSSNDLREAFRLESQRRQRQGDGTISVDGVRFEVPARYRHFQDVTVRYARWDLGRVDVVDPRNGTILAPLYPQDRTANADARRLLVEPADGGPASGEAPADAGPRAGAPGLPPLLKRILDEYSALGIPPAYLPKEPGSEKGGAES
jgi:putative transposase